MRGRERQCENEIWRWRERDIEREKKRYGEGQ